MQKLKHLEPYKDSKKFTINENKNLNSLKLTRMRKILYNRNEPSAHEIRKKQDFNLVVKKYNRNKDYWKNPWFYGSIGIASILSSLFLLNM